MLHLTPQEKSVLAFVAAAFMLGTGIAVGLKQEAKPLRWVKTAQKIPHKKIPDLNFSDAKELERLPGIGPKSAQAIIAYRNEHGPFISFYGLRYVKGITKKNFLKIAEFYQQQGGM